MEDSRAVELIQAIDDHAKELAELRKAVEVLPKALAWEIAKIATMLAPTPMSGEVELAWLMDSIKYEPFNEETEE